MDQIIPRPTARARFIADQQIRQTYTIAPQPTNATWVVDEIRDNNEQE